MRSSLIVIDTRTADIATLREQCTLLGIAIQQDDSLEKIRGELDSYYKLRRQWIELSDRIFGARLTTNALVRAPFRMDHSCDTVEEIREIIAAFLGAWLAHDGYIHSEGKGKTIRDCRNNTTLHIIATSTATSLNAIVTNADGTKVVESIDTLHAARCAFDDINTIVAAWEKWKATDGT